MLAFWRFRRSFVESRDNPPSKPNRAKPTTDLKVLADAA
jgi:hypothetical protein